MEEVKYHPLIDNDASGKEKVPMFCSTDVDTIRTHHNFYLEEIVTDYYRLVSNNSHNKSRALSYNIHCPSCGTMLVRISEPLNEHKLCLYTCNKCRNNN